MAPTFTLTQVLGTIGNLNIPEFDFYYLVREHRLMEFLAAHLAPGEVDDDIMLEVSESVVHQPSASADCPLYSVCLLCFLSASHHPSR